MLPCISACLTFLPFYTDEDGNQQSDNLVDKPKTFFPLNMARSRSNFQFPHITHLAYIRVTHTVNAQSYFIRQARYTAVYRTRYTYGPRRC